jgi:hypothetical protein
MKSVFQRDLLPGEDAPCFFLGGKDVSKRRNRMIGLHATGHPLFPVWFTPGHQSGKRRTLIENLFLCVSLGKEIT